MSLLQLTIVVHLALFPVYVIESFKLFVYKDITDTSFANVAVLQKTHCIQINVSKSTKFPPFLFAYTYITFYILKSLQLLIKKFYNFVFIKKTPKRKISRKPLLLIVYCFSFIPSIILRNSAFVRSPVNE